MNVARLIFEFLSEKGYYCTHHDYGALSFGYGKHYDVVTLSSMEDLTLSFSDNQITVKKEVFRTLKSDDYLYRNPTFKALGVVDIYNSDSLDQLLKICVENYGKPKLLDRVARTIRGVGKYYKKFRKFRENK
tara:strand:- start:73297 stop:73692 length:396 start_codon:yes stop_codon:yes gene_type:complete